MTVHGFLSFMAELRGLTSLPFELDLNLIRRLDRNGPRYTSYPTADRFVDTFNPDTYKSWIARRHIGGGEQHALSIDVHLPFCSTVCFYCACNKVITANKARGVKYLRYLKKEIELHSALFHYRPHVEQMHWGGGTPTFFENDLRALANDGLVTFNDQHITVTAKGRLLIRNVCMVFDRYLRGAQEGARYSRVI